MKTAIKFRNFFLNNTPAKAQLIGDISMILGFIAGLPAFISEAAATQGMEIALPHILIAASKWCAIILFMVKGFTKLMGSHETTQNK